MGDPVKEPAELGHALRHLQQARVALERGYPCEARAHLREAQADIRWTLKPVTAACAETAAVSYLHDGERCTATTAAGARCMSKRHAGREVCFMHTRRPAEHEQGHR